ncbi:MAG: SpoIIE family protein phosphatase [Desulfuromonadales bacterium]|nr:SpoIIE family protein phosphatase [Desulfuromonadales bacterium]
MSANECETFEVSINTENIETTDLLTLIGHNASVNGDCQLEQVYEDFQHHCYEFVAVTDENQHVLGICSREEVGLLLGLRFGRELFARKAVHEQLSRPSSQVTVGDRITSVLDHAMSRSEQYYFDDVVLVDQSGRYVGLIPMRTLILLQHRFLLETIKRLERQRREIEERQQEMEKDLILASRMQQTMLQQQSCLPQHKTTDEIRPYRLKYRYVPATNLVSGDFFHTFALADGLFGVLICDVMGHGVRSALVTAMIRALAETHTRTANDPGVFLSNLNRDLFLLLNHTDGPQFVTAQYLLLDIDNGLVHHAVAGHHPPLHLKRKECLFTPLASEHNSDGPPLGIIEDFSYGTNITPVANGDLILLYTDGLFEVFSPEGEEYGQKRLQAALQERCLLTLPEIFDEILADLAIYTGKNSFPDDICLIGLEVSKHT